MHANDYDKRIYMLIIMLIIIVCGYFYIQERKPKEIDYNNLAVEASADNKLKLNLNEASIDDFVDYLGVDRDIAVAMYYYKLKIGIYETVDELKGLDCIDDDLYVEIKDRLCAE